MKTNIFAPMKKNLTIPAASVKIAGLDGQDLEAHLGDGAIVLFREEMEAKELIDTIEFLKDLSTDLTVALACACGQAEPAPMSRFTFDETGSFQSATANFDFGTDYGANCVQLQAGDDCTHCKTPCHGVEIPECMLRDACIDPEVGLQFDTRDGEIIIREIDDDWGDEDDFDITDYVPEGLLTVLRNSGVCLDELREMLEDERIIYG